MKYSLQTIDRALDILDTLIVESGGSDLTDILEILSCGEACAEYGIMYSDTHASELAGGMVKSLINNGRPSVALLERYAPYNL